jgi:coenzyme PQQ biosynthesis protein PqqD
MQPQARPKFGKGVRLRREPDRAMLLVPENMLVLNESSASTLELVDGTRTLDEIACALVDRFEVSYEDALAGASDLLDRLAERRWIES